MRAPRRVFIEATDPAGIAIADLRPADFEVREAGEKLYNPRQITYRTGAFPC